MRANHFLLLSLLAPSLAWAVSGSDDHYLYKNVDETDGPDYAGFNPATHGDSALLLGTGDSQTFELPFIFDFYGTEWSQVTLHSNGVLSMGSGSESPGAYSTGACLAAGHSGAFIAPYWFEWDLDSWGETYYLEYPNAVFAFWNGVRTSLADTSNQSFGVWLFESGEIVMVYEDTSSGRTATSNGRAGAVGMQASGSLGISLGCESSFLNDTLDTFYLSPHGTRHFVGEVSSSSANVVTMLGLARSDWFGRYVANGGDLNGDGIDEILVGAPYNDSSAGAAGATYIYQGGPTFTGSLTTSSAWSTVLGTSTTDQSGTALAGARDLDGDGLDDIMIGAPYRGSSDTGAVALFMGASLGGSLAFASADAMLTGASDDLAGWSVAFSGDINADGYQDLLIGAMENSISGTDSGAAYLVLGDSTWADLDLVDSDATLIGESASDNAGYRVASAGDIDSDGIEDIIVGAVGVDSPSTNAGAFYVILGSEFSTGTTGLASYSRITGATASDVAGVGMASAGDLDGDGFGDLFLGAYSAGVAGGEAYFVRGTSGDLISSLADAYTTVQGDANDRLGFSVSNIDLGLDGENGMVVGAYGASDSASSGGAVHVFSAESLLEGGILDDDSARGTLLPAASLSSAHFGRETAVGDFNGDGLHDILIGAYQGDGSASDSGSAYVAMAGTTYPDIDGDGFISVDFGGPDCDDSSSDISPEATDLCDGIDNDCDGVADEGNPDTDGDGIADCSDTEECDGLDNDGDGSIDEGMPDTDGDRVCDAIDAETCDGIDNDGDGAIDEDFPDTDMDGIADCMDSETCDGLDNDGDGSIDEGFLDSDKDGTADCVEIEECDGIDNNGNDEIDEGYPDTDLDGTADCVDTEECDGLDNNGDGAIDEGYADTDKDSIADCVDIEECDGLDNNGDGEEDEGFPDTDSDGIADCVDTEECDGIDNDGDGQTDEGYPDTDSDNIADCVDNEECDGIDNNGDGTIDEGYPDTDSDGTADCIDTEECDGLDNNGDGSVDEGFGDSDGDGVADCIDTEECDGVDNNGDGVIDEGYADNNGDGQADCLDDPADDTGEDPGDKGCDGCASSGGSPAAAFLSLLALGALLRRRQRT